MELLLEGRVRLDSGTPVSGVQVLLFDQAGLRAASLGARPRTGRGQFTLPLATLAGVLPEQMASGYRCHNGPVSPPG